MRAKDGGYAFPHSSPLGGEWGLTKREYYAGQALIAMIISQEILRAVAISNNLTFEAIDPYVNRPIDAFRYADAMVEESKK